MCNWGKTIYQYNVYWGKTLYQCNVYLGETIYDISTAAIEKLSPRYAGNVLLLVCTALGMFALPVSGLVDVVVVVVHCVRSCSLHKICSHLGLGGTL